MFVIHEIQPKYRRGNHIRKVTGPAFTEEVRTRICIFPVSVIFFLSIFIRLVRPISLIKAVFSLSREKLRHNWGK